MVFVFDADAVQVQLSASSLKNRVRAAAEAGAGGRAAWIGRTAAYVAAGIKRCRQARIIKRRIEVAHAVVGFVSVRNAVPAQTEVQGQAAIDAPVVLDPEGGGDVVPFATVRDSKLLVGLGKPRSMLAVLLPVKSLLLKLKPPCVWPKSC